MQISSENGCAKKGKKTEFRNGCTKDWLACGKIQQKSYGIPVMEIHFPGLMEVCGAGTSSFLLNSSDKQRRHLW